MARRRPTEPTVNPARGAALVVVAVIVGLFLLRNGLDTSEVVTASGEESSADDGGGDTNGADDGSDVTDDGSATTEDTTPEARPPAQVPVIVLNGSGVGGAAGTYSEVLGSLGYQLTDADGANANANVPTSQVLYAEGFEQEAIAVTAAIGAPSLVPAPLTEPSPGEIVGASVVVVLGPDLANVTPTTAASTDAGTTDAATDDTATDDTTTDDTAADG
jgi:hypothetical protein